MCGKVIEILILSIKSKFVIYVCGFLSQVCEFFNHIVLIWHFTTIISSNFTSITSFHLHWDNAPTAVALYFTAFKKQLFHSFARLFSEGLKHVLSVKHVHWKAVHRKFWTCCMAHGNMIAALRKLEIRKGGEK